MISDEYTVVLLFETSDAYANLIAQAFTTTGCPHLLKHVTNVVGLRDYLTNSLDENSTEKFIRPRLILMSGNKFDREIKNLLGYIKSHKLLKLIPIVVFCSNDCDASIGRENLMNINSFVKRQNNHDSDRDTITSVARYWLKWNNLPP